MQSFSHFSIAFTSAGLFLSLIAPLLITFFLWVIARRVPPAVSVPGIKSGVGGLLLAFLFCMCVEATLELFKLGRDAGEVARVISMSSDYAWPAVKTLLPGLIGVCALMGSILTVTLGRSRGALWSAIVLLWIAGPGADLLKAAILGIPFNPNQGFAGVSVFTVVFTLYLLFSNRTAYLFGLSSARRVLAAWDAKQSASRG